MTMAAGNYLIGDLCYCFSTKTWEEINELTFGMLEGEFNLSNGTRFALFNMNNPAPNAIHETSMGFDVSIDSGTVGCVHLKDIERPIPEGCKILEVEFDKQFKVKRSKKIIQFGKVKVNPNRQCVTD